MINLYTAQEIADILRRLGCEAESELRLYDDYSRVNSKTYGIPWQVVMLGSAPFHTELLTRVPLWVEGDPLRWTNDWNCSRSSQAFAVHDPATRRPIKKGRRRLVGIEALLSFGDGVKPEYVIRFLGWWIMELKHLRVRPQVEFFEELSL
jgi:hypothetical protein